MQQKTDLDKAYERDRRLFFYFGYDIQRLYKVREGGDWIPGFYAVCATHPSEGGIVEICRDTYTVELAVLELYRAGYAVSAFSWDESEHRYTRMGLVVKKEQRGR